MIFGSGYQAPPPGPSHLDRTMGGFTIGEDQIAIEGTASARQVIGTADLGMSVTEGSRFGSLVQTATEAIRTGTGSIELATIQGGGEPGGAESYGWEARRALRELAKANNVYFSSVHTPSNTVGNLSGYNYQEKGFNDELRHRSLEEVKKAIIFAADVGAGAVVVHTGEAQRDMSRATWNKEVSPGVKQFLSFDEEPGRQVLHMVDDRTGKVITEVRKSMVVYEPKFKMTTDENGVERYIDKDGKMLDETNIEDLFRRVPEWDSSRTKFQSKKRTWDYFVKISNRWNEENKRLHPLTGEQIPWTPEEMFFRKQIESRILQSRGSSLYHGRDYDNLIHDREVLLKSLKYYEKVEKDMPEDELYKLEGHPVPGLKSHWGREAQEFVASERKTPTQKIKEALKNVELQMKYTHEASAAADAQSDDLLESLHHVVPVERYAKEKSSWSYAEAGILAWEQTHDNPHAKKDVFVAPENLFPEMGYGTHPEELIELVTKARARMVEMLTAKEIQNPNELRYIDEEHGGQRLLHKINNPYFTGMNEKEAEEIASKHIRATFDTQHLGMWWKHFQPLPGEKYAERKARFDGWYKEMVDKMIDKDIIGHVHAVDAMGGGHHHLPVGQGNIPVKWALERLKEKGFKGSMISEGHEEDSRFGKGRQAAISWRNLGSPYVGKGYSIAAPSQAFSGIHQSYFRNMQSPYFIFGAYSPSNDWQLWSQVPME